jgi:4-hydroxy-3-polyprenylbenzoate decarboxylase
MLHDERTAAVHIAAVHHGSQHLRKWWARGTAAPIAVAVSPDPYLYLAAAETLPWGTSEYEFAGFLKGSPEEVFPGPRTGLPLPAHAELIVEGEVPPPTEEQRLEGPFGEYTGYYADVQIPRPVIRVQALYYRTNPILHGDPPLKPPVLTIACPPARTLLLVWDGLEKAGLPGIEGVYPLTAGGDFLLVVSIKQQYAGHAREVGLEASKLIPGSGRLIVVVDDDIDPSSSDEVLWAIATRTDPATTFAIQDDCPASMIDPMISPTRKKAGGLKGSRAVIVACRPWEWRDEFPPVNRNSDALRQRILDKWQTLFDYERAGARAAQIQELLV